MMNEYRFVQGLSHQDLDERVNALAKDGFRVAHMSQSEDAHDLHYMVCMVREARD